MGDQTEMVKLRQSEFALLSTVVQAQSDVVGTAIAATIDSFATCADGRCGVILDQNIGNCG